MEEVLSVKEFAQQISRSTLTVYKLLKEQRVPVRIVSDTAIGEYRLWAVQEVVLQINGGHDIETRERVFWQIVEYKEDHNGNSPTSEWLAEKLGISSKSTIHYHLGRLEQDGEIRRSEPMAARGIEVTDGHWEYRGKRVRPQRKVYDDEVGKP